MKKTILAGLLVTVVLNAYAQSGVIKEITGTVELKPSGATGYTAARAGDTVAEDTIISTGLKSTAMVEVGSTAIAVLPLTRLTLTEIRSSQGNETLNVNLQAGRVRVDVTPLAGNRASTTVNSPISTASVRGTSFYFDTRNLHVREGSVNFKGNKGYTIKVGAGFASFVDRKGNAAPSQFTGAASDAEGFMPSMPPGYDPSSGNIGAGGGMIDIPDEPPGTGGIKIDYEPPSP